MDSRTLELFRCLQSGPYDESGFKQIQRLLSGQCRVLRSRNDLATLAEIVQLLEGWANAAVSGRLRAAALGEAAEIAERELRQLSLADDLRERAAQRTRADARVSVTSARTVQMEPTPKETTLDEAIAAWEDFLEADPNQATVQHLAELYTRRGGDGDLEQAADLYCMLGELMGNPAGLGMVQQALQLSPDHADAQALLERYTAEIRASVPTVTLNVPAPVENSSRTRHATLSGMVTPAPPPLSAAEPPATPALGVAALAPPPAIGASAGGAPAPPLRAAVQSFPALGSAAYQAPPPLPAPVQLAPAPPPLPLKSAPTSRAPVMLLQIPANPSGSSLRVMPASSLSPVVIDEAGAQADPPPPRRKRGWAFGGLALAATATALVFLYVRSREQSPASASASTGPVRHEAHSPASAPGKPEPTVPAAQPAPPAAAAPAAAVPAQAETPAAAEQVGPPLPAAVENAPAKTPAVQALLEQASLRGGALNQQLLAATLDKLNAKLVACYEQALTQKPRLKGRIILGWTVKTNGRVANVKSIAGTTIKDQALIDCTSQAIDGARFPKPRKQPAKIKLPFQYRQS